MTDTQGTILFLIIWFLPFFLILFSKKKKNQKNQKNYLTFTFFISWIGWILYFVSDDIEKLASKDSPS